jgi:alkylation response protein AidB-like acyl-CoA dehydrogenase
MKLSSEPASVIDTSKMSEGQRAALETTEAAREHVKEETFAASLFMGRPDFARLLPFPHQTVEDEDQGDAFIERLSGFLTTHADPDAIDREGETPDDVMQGLAQLGAFGIKIPKTYGGLGLSQTNYARAAMWLGGFCGNITALLSAHQSIGVPQPLLLFGTDEQKKKWLTRCAAGEISAFALTETEVGSDPARMRTTAVPTEDGKSFVINGEKLWCTNGTRAGFIVVMARTPATEGSMSGRTPITAFIVDMDTPGVEVVRRCRFMGLRALYNGVIRFKDAVVPRENIILGEGKGLRVALTTLNTGRLTLPAACAGAMHRCLEWSRDWATKREQWGAPIAKHAAIAEKLARMSARAFALESVVRHVCALVDQDKHADIRLEAAIAKLWGTERAWETINDTMQIRGGRGYETAESLRARGEEGVPIERFLRDARINTIFEGSTEIMRLFIAREALDPHLQKGGAVLNSKLPFKVRLSAAWNATKFYAGWLPRTFKPVVRVPDDLKNFRREARKVTRLSHKLARRIFSRMVRFGPKLEREQLVLGHLADAGAELYIASAVIARTESLLARESDPAARQRLTTLARYACRLSLDACSTHLLLSGSSTERMSKRVAKYLAA